MKYSPNFERQLEYAAYDCAERGSQELGVDHLLLALYRMDFPLLHEVFATFRVDALALLDRILRANPEGAARVGRDAVQLSPHALGVIAAAETEAQRLGHGILKPPHTLLGLLVYERERLERYFIREEIVSQREDEVLAQVRDVVAWLRFASEGHSDRELEVLDRRTVVGLESIRLRSSEERRQNGYAVHVTMLKTFG